MKTSYFAKCQTIEEVKILYKQLALKHHPDREGGNTQIMQEINAEYQSISKNAFFKFEEQTEGEKEDFNKYPDIINQIINLNGVLIELIGDWIWLSGNTYQHRQILKELGFFFASKKLLWYYRPSEYKSLNRKPKHIDEIRNKYGSERVQNKYQDKEIAA